MKKVLFEYLNERLKGPRAEYERLLDAPDYVEGRAPPRRRTGT